MTIVSLHPFMDTAVAHHLMLHAQFVPPVLVYPYFATDPTWLRRLDAMLVKADLEPGPVVVDITIIHPLPAGTTLPSAGDPPDEAFINKLIQVLAEHGLAATANRVIIKETARPRVDACLDLAIYGGAR